MAFYPDELSPIDRIRGLGKQTDSLSDIGTLKNRRQWKSLSIGKKELGMNNFAPIAEEKEEEISSDGSQGTTSNRGASSAFVLNPGVVASKKITFPKPRKYITPRVSDIKEEALFKSNGNPAPLVSLESPLRKFLNLEVDLKKAEPNCNDTSASKSNVLDAKQLLKSEKSKEFISSTQDFIQNYSLSETLNESQWNETFSEGTNLMSWLRHSHEKITSSKQDTETISKCMAKERRKSSGSSKSSAVTDVARRDTKGGKRKSSASSKPLNTREEVSSTNGPEKTSGGKGVCKAEKGKTLNMKEVVNVYKNLAYGSKEEIKSFVENLSLVKDDSKAEIDKNLLSMMNLKALENKIKNFAKKPVKKSETAKCQEKKPKVEKPIKKSRKAHIERLARHKVVKAPSIPSSACQKNAINPTDADKFSDQKGKRFSFKSREPWKYVGMQSALDKTYFLYPAYPHSVNLKNGTRTKKACTKESKVLVKMKKGSAKTKIAEAEPKVKGPPAVVKPNMGASGGGTRSHYQSVSRPANKGTNRSSAMTVCTVNFRPGVGQKVEESPVGTTDQSLLVYLHGAKAIHVKSPYADKQFSRVKFFRKDEGGVPLIKGFGRRTQPKGNQAVSIRNISLPQKLTKLKTLDLLDFDEDIQNITDFLRSQGNPDRRNAEEWQGLKKTEEGWCPKETPKDADASTYRHQRRQRRTTQDSHLHPHGTHFHPQHRLHKHIGPSGGAMSPDSLINEISKNIHHLQYLPDTEDNRKMIGEFFDELDQRIDETRNGALTLQKLHSTPDSDPFGRIPILGY